MGRAGDSMIRRIDTTDDIAEGLAALARLDPRLAPMIALAGEVPLRRGEGGFQGLARIIVGQQLSVASAAAIWGRVAERWPLLTPEAVLAADDATLQACGLSRPKQRTLRATAEAAAKGALDWAALAEAPENEVREAITAVKGLGPWTADIYLLFHLGHADAFAPGDLALQEAARIGLTLDTRPDAKRLATIAETWSPWRGVAARMLWAYYAKAKTREGIAL